MYASFGKVRSVFAKVGSLYTECLTRSPYVTNCTTGFIVATAGDVLCQKYMEDNKSPSQGSDVSINAQDTPIDVDVRRALEMGLIRASLVTPFTQFWYGFLLRVAPGSVLKRVLIDQAIGSPLVIAMVFTAKGILQLDLNASKEMITTNLVKTWIAGMSYWPFVHAINFRFVPLMYQPTFATFASLYWNAVLSYYANNVKKNKAEQTTVVANVPVEVATMRLE